ncbi:MAG: hypothetical protein ACKVUS_15175 [Saprospiraceae bacterium]
MEKAKLLIVFCEGPHDAEFLARVLRVLNGCEDHTGKKLRDYPLALGSYYEGALKRLPFLDKNKGSVFSDVPLPVILKQAAQTFVLVHSMRGDSKWEQAKPVFNNFLDLAASTTFGNFEVNFALFYDSDEHGVKAREEKARGHLTEIFPNEGEALSTLRHSSPLKLLNRILVGTFVFTGQDQTGGDLEDIMLPIMCQDELGKHNAEIFQEASKFVDRFFDEKRVRKQKEFNPKKSIIGIAGQLQFSGVHNTVVIQRSDYLSDEKLRSSPQVKEIAAFFQQFFDAM